MVTKCILNSTELKCTKNIKLYHFVHSILSVPFCPMPFCPYTILSIPFCPYHFIRYHFVRSPAEQYKRVGRTLPTPRQITLLFCTEAIIYSEIMQSMKNATK